MGLRRILPLSLCFAALALIGCQSRKAEVIRAVVKAELSQSLNSVPSDIEVTKIRFVGEHEAFVEVKRRAHGPRLRDYEKLVCRVVQKSGRWAIEETRTQNRFSAHPPPPAG